MRSWRWVVLLLLLSLAIAFPLAKTLVESQGGTVEGYVVDQKGSPVPGASVEARNTLHGVVSRAASNASGFYRFDVAPGHYSLWAEAKGHSCEWIPRVAVEQGKHTRQDFQLTCELRDSVPVPVR